MTGGYWKKRLHTLAKVAAKTRAALPPVASQAGGGGTRDITEGSFAHPISLKLESTCGRSETTL